MSNAEPMGWSRRLRNYARQNGGWTDLTPAQRRRWSKKHQAELRREHKPDRDAIAGQEIEARRSQQFNCSDPPEESCSDAACPVHADGDDPEWGDGDIIKDAGSLRDWGIVPEEDQAGARHG